MISLKYIDNSLRILEMPLINCEVNLITIWSANYFIMPGANGNQVATFSITDTKLYVSRVTLSTQDSAKLINQLK